jgi:hypothetical protein
MEQQRLDGWPIERQQVVSVTPEVVFDARRDALRRAFLESIGDAPVQATAFALRILRRSDVERLTLSSPDVAGRLDADTTDLASAAGLAETVVYGGVPQLAALGFALARVSEVDPAHAGAFLDALDRLRQRPVGALDVLADDDLALLGIADGLHVLKHEERASASKVWLAGIINSRVGSDEFSMRVRALALDSLDERGRLRSEVPYDSHDVLALDLVAQNVWPEQYVGSAVVSRDARKRLFSMLLDSNAHHGDVEKSALHLAALERLFDDAAATALPTVEALIRMLRDTQTSLKRWVWQSKAGRAGTEPARWLIDEERHVQSFLWTALYPIFRDDLRDEQYLVGFGMKQPRYDLAVVSLQTIIEVKFVRRAGDFEAVEEEVAGDLGIYFADARMFTRMVVYVYDDSDDAAPERYAVLRNALRARDSRLIDVVVVRRPSMIPGRKERGQKSPAPSVRARSEST